MKDDDSKEWDLTHLKIKIYREPFDGGVIIAFIDKNREREIEESREWKRKDNIIYSDNPYYDAPILTYYESTDIIREALDYYDKLNNKGD